MLVNLLCESSSISPVLVVINGIFARIFRCASVFVDGVQLERRVMIMVTREEEREIKWPLRRQFGKVNKSR